MEREIESQITPSYVVKCLLIPSSSIDFVALDKGFNYISANPVLESNGGTVRVVFEDISTEELTSLFISAGATYRLSIPFEIRCSATL